MKKMDIVNITSEMVDVVREYVSHYATDVAYDVATIANSTENYTCWLWLVRENGTHIVLCDDTKETIEYVNTIYDVFGDNIHPYLIDKRFDTRVSKYHYTLYPLLDREEALMYV